MKILYLASWYPYPPDNGSRQRTFYLLKYLATHHEISLLALKDAEQEPIDVEPIRTFAKTIQTYPRPLFNPHRARALAAFLSPRPRSIVDTYDPALAALIQNTVSQTRFDLIFASQLTMAAYAAQLQHPFRVFDEAEVGLYQTTDSSTSSPQKLRHQLMWRKYTRFLRSLARQFAFVSAVSPQEANLLTKLGISSRKIHVIPNGVDIASIPPLRETYEPNSLIYPGAVTFGANLDAMRYFVSEILPLVHAGEPRARLTITGRAPKVAIKELSGDNLVSFTGYVSDVRPLIQASAVCIVPLRLGGGTRLKILEAMALGTPVVTTRKGAEGLSLVPDEHFLVADSPSEFASATLRILHDSALRSRLVHAAYNAVRSEYDWQGIVQRFDGFLSLAA